jgi:hypothetical protein
MLSHRGQDMDREPVRHRHVGRDELDAALHEAGHEMDIAGQAIELGNEQGSFVLPAGLQRRPSCGRPARALRPLPVSTSVNSPKSFQPPPLR